jgi:peptidyl-prolyl cis-trans isomerase C
VNGEPIPILNVRVFAERHLANGTIPKDQRALAYRTALDQFVVRELLFQEALVRGLEPDRKTIDAAEDKARGAYTDEKVWVALLAEQGLTPDRLKAEVRIQQTVNALLEQEAAKIPPETVSDEEIAHYYETRSKELEVAERVEIGQILIRLPADVAAQRKGNFRTRAEQILTRIRTGESFEALALQHSDDRQKGVNGGRLPPFGKGEMHPSLAGMEAAALALEPGEVSDVIETPAGFHILKLYQRLPGGKRPLPEIAGQIRATLLQRRRAEALDKLVTRLRARARIETYL